MTLVTTDWLSSRLRDPNVVILDATLPPVGVSPAPDTRARYLAEHLPGAVFFDIDELSDHTSGLPHTLPSAESFAASMSALGIADTASIVIYEQAGVFSAPRAWWMLRTFGAANVHLLDGGLEAWLAAGLPTESGPVQRPAATFRATLDAHAVRDFAAIQELIAGHAQTPVQILDARSAGRFTGVAPEPRPGLRSGHMPGATSLPFTELVADGRLRPPAELREIFAAKGLDITQPITTTCGSGVTAAVLALGLELAGATQVSLYDGSWAEYAQHPDATIFTDEG
jgi:thiosulfate/3-mercaptopyruvate sulfurtransferase